MLMNKGKEAVFVYYYTPGHQMDRKMYNIMEKESSRPEYADFVFMSVHCRKHINFCMSKYSGARSTPMAELYYINEQDKIELMDIDRWDRSPEGIKAFF